MAALRLDDHPTVRSIRAKGAAAAPKRLSAAALRRWCLEAGADDVGFVEVGRSAIRDQRGEIELLLPGAKSLVSLVRRMNRESIRTPARSIANIEFHLANDEATNAAREIVARLEREGVRAVNGAVGFPMEMDRWPEKAWILSHKPIAVAAGLGHMDIHRNVIHPRFGNFILLETVVIDAEIDEYSQPLDYNPCLECKLCVAACPVGAISSDGHFNFSACLTHNYREFMGGFSDWVETVAESGSARDYRKKFSDSETVSMWQSLGFGPNYKAAYCMAVCPAGEDVIGPYLADRKAHLDNIVRPLQDKAETIYVVAGSDAEGYVPRRFPNKRVKRVRNGLRVASIRGFLRGITLTFQRERAKGLDAVYHFTFTGKEERLATVTIRDRNLKVEDGHVGKADLAVTADSETWLRFLRKEANLAVALLRAKVRLKGPPRLLTAFGRCFPS